MHPIFVLFRVKEEFVLIERAYHTTLKKNPISNKVQFYFKQNVDNSRKRLSYFKQNVDLFQMC